MFLEGKLLNSSNGVTEDNYLNKIALIYKQRERDVNYISYEKLPNYYYHHHIKPRGNNCRVNRFASSTRGLTIIVGPVLLSELPKEKLKAGIINSLVLDLYRIEERNLKEKH